MNKKPLTIMFAGTPDFAASHLSALLSSPKHDSLYKICGVYTQPDRPAGRGNKLQSSPVKLVAAAYDLPIFQPQNFKNQDAIDQLQQQPIDLMIVVAYGLLLPVSVLKHPRLGCINVHGSLLPKWRGAAPIQRAIWANDKQTGITIMQMDEGLDTGAILCTETIAIKETDTSENLYLALAEIGPKILIKAIELLVDNKMAPTPQNDNLASYAHKLTKKEACIDWSQSAIQIDCAIRAFNPWPISYFNYEDLNIKVWKAQVLHDPDLDSSAPENQKHTHKKPAGTIVHYSKYGLDIATADGIIRLLELQLPNKKRMSIADIINARSHWFQVGERLMLPEPALPQKIKSELT